LEWKGNSHGQTFQSVKDFCQNNDLRNVFTHERFNAIARFWQPQRVATVNTLKHKTKKHMKTTKLILTALPLILCGLFASGCAEVMAIKQPRPFTPTTLVTGAKRVDIIGELGQPISSEEHTNSLTDAYKYVDGGRKNSGGSKTVRVVLYTGGDLFTCWLDQIVWMPTEKFGFAGTDHAVTVDFTKADDGFWHAAKIEDKPLKGNSSQKEAF